MRIVNLVESLETGGAEVLVSSVCALHKRQGHHPEVHCLFGSGPLAKRLEDADVPVRVYTGSKPARIYGLYRGLQSRPPDVVHCHNAVTTIWGAPLARLVGTRAVVSTRHGMVRPGVNGQQEMRYWLAARFCDRVVAVCETAHRNLAAGRFSDARKIATIYNGAAPAVSSGAITKPNRDDKFTLISVGRLVKEKDHETLLQAIAIVRLTVPDVRLWIVGDGPERHKLEALAVELGIVDLVTFVGEVREVGDWLDRAHVFVMSSNSEGLPIALLEAMAASLPFIVTNVGGMPEIAALSGSGRLVPPQQPRMLAAAITSCADDRGEIALAGARSKACYQDRFTVERLAVDCLRLYEQLIGSQEVSGRTAEKWPRS